VCVVGGGYTGDELVAELDDFFHDYVIPRYRSIGERDYRLVLLEASGEILRGVHPTLAAHAHRKLRREGIEVRTNTRVTRVRADAVEVAGGESLPVGLTVWAGGVTGHPVLAQLPVDRDRQGRIIVTRQLRLARHPEVYGAGDAVVVRDKPEVSIPIVPAALAQARLAAGNLIADLEGRRLADIDFAPRGMLVSLGERDAVVELMGARFSGYLAWLFWNAVHLYKLVGLRKQIQVALDWSLAQIFPRDSSIIRRPSRCPICARLRRSERSAA